MNEYDRDALLHGGMDEYDAPREPKPFCFTINGTDALTWLTPGEPVNDTGTDGIYLDATRNIWRVVYNNRLHPCEWPYEYRILAEQCFADLCRPADEAHHFHIHPYTYEK